MTSVNVRLWKMMLMIVMTMRIVASSTYEECSQFQKEPTEPGAAVELVLGRRGSRL